MDDPNDSVTMIRAATSSGAGAPPRAAETIERARTLRGEHARAAAYQAHRVEQARAASHDAEAARWSEEYRRSVARCRRLGKLIRAVQAERTNDDPTTGEAA